MIILTTLKDHLVFRPQAEEFSIILLLYLQEKFNDDVVNRSKLSVWPLPIYRIIKI
jgi:hypothetical protein